MQIPKEPEQWIQKFSALTEEKKYDYWRETIKSKSFKKLIKKVDIIDYLLNYLGVLEKNKQQEKILNLINEFKEKRSDIEDRDFSYLEKYEINIKLFKNEEIGKEDFKSFLNQPERVFDNLNQMLKKLAYYNYSQLVDDISREIFSDIKEAPGLIGGAEIDLAYNIYFYKWQQVYNKLKENKEVNWQQVRSYLNKYDFDIQEVYKEIVTIFKEGKDLENAFEKDIHEFMTGFKFSLAKYMYEEKNINFITSHYLWKGFLNLVLDPNVDVTNGGIRSLSQLFSIERDVFNQNIRKFSGFTFDRSCQLFGVLWGLPYIYNFTYDKNLIPELIYKSALKIINWKKEEMINQYSDDLWNYNFVHNWEPIYFADREKLTKEKELFEKSYQENIEVVIEDFTYEAQKDYIKNSKGSSFSDVGRNDSCPCGSGKKYKKCCLNRMEKKMRERKKHDYKRNYIWTEREVENMKTEQIIDQLFYFGLYFSKKAFMKKIKEYDSIKEIIKEWYQNYDIKAEDFDHDFIKIAPEVLYKRWK